VLDLTDPRHSITRSRDGLKRYVASFVRRLRSKFHTAVSERGHRPSESGLKACPQPALPLTLAEVDRCLRGSLGSTFSCLSEDSLRSLRTQVIWSRIEVLEPNACDASPGFNGVKALEIELRRQLVTPGLLAAVQVDAVQGHFPPEGEARLASLLASIRAHRPTFGQCVGILRALAECRRACAETFEHSSSGVSLRSLRGGYDLLDHRFLNDLQRVVDRYRNPAAHGAVGTWDTADFERLLFGNAADGLLPFLLFATRPRQAGAGMLRGEEAE